MVDYLHRLRFLLYLASNFILSLCHVRLKVYEVVIGRRRNNIVSALVVVKSMDHNLTRFNQLSTGWSLFFDIRARLLFFKEIVEYHVRLFFVVCRCW